MCSQAGKTLTLAPRSMMSCANEGIRPRVSRLDWVVIPVRMWNVHTLQRTSKECAPAHPDNKMPTSKAFLSSRCASSHPYVHIVHVADSSITALILIHHNSRQAQPFFMPLWSLETGAESRQNLRVSACDGHRHIGASYRRARRRNRVTPGQGGHAWVLKTSYRRYEVAHGPHTPLHSTPLWGNG